MFDEDELTPEQKFAAEDAERTVPHDLARGRGREEIIADLLRLGYTPAAANALVERAAADLERYRASPEERGRLVQESFRQMIAGLILSAGGVAWGVLALLFSGGFIGLWVIPPWVIVFVGLLIAGRGYTRWRMYRSDDFLPR